MNTSADTSKTKAIPQYDGQAAFEWLTKSLSREVASLKAEKIKITVEQIIDAVRTDGDNALIQMAEKYGDPILPGFKLSKEQIEEAIANVSPQAKEAIDKAAKNIRAFAEAVMAKAQPVQLDTEEFSTGLIFTPVERAGCYVPGGKFPLPSTALMTAITASVAGVEDICIATPSLCNETTYAGSISGVKEFYITGGAQAVAALALGTESIEKVDMVVGPGNAYVTEAKRQLSADVGIDMLAGPSEIAIIADSSQNPAWIAIDMISQAEHGPDASAYLITDSKELANRVTTEIDKLMTEYQGSLSETTLEQFAIFTMPSIKECVDFSNKLAPEHLELQVDDPWQWKSRLTSYGALFIGAEATVPYGDYAAGPNHTLPTNRSARYTGALNPFTFLRAQTWLEVKPGAKTLPATTVAMAEIEGLSAHAQAARVRMES